MEAIDLEIRCQKCGAGFPLGTRTCIHCQEPLGSRPRLPTDSGNLKDSENPSGAEEAMGLWLRIGQGLVANLCVALSVVSRMCSGDAP